MKPIGCYHALGGPSDPPPWITWGKVETNVDRRRVFAEAAALSARRPFWWVVQINEVGIEALAPSILNDVIDSGLWPHVKGVEIFDEPLSNADAGTYAHLGPMWRTKAERWARLDAGHAWICDEYAALDAAMPKGWTRIYADHFYQSNRAYGPEWWRPCPPQAQVIQLTSYNLSLLPTILDVAVTTQPRDLMLTPRWFSATDDVYGPMTAEAVAAYPTLLAHPRVFGACGYFWATIQAHRDIGFTGLDAMPGWQRAVEASLGVMA